MTDDVLCLSHLRWDFVFQAPHHLMTRLARDRRLFYIEEPVFDISSPELTIDRRPGGVQVVVSHLPRSLYDAMRSEGEIPEQLRALLDGLLEEQGIEEPVLWYYTPMALTFTRHIDASAIVYNCMEELSAFRDAPAQLLRPETELFERADLVFTGGQSLYEVKWERHPSVHCFPSALDAAHFKQARASIPSVVDQAMIPRPRLGFYGVIDERMDLELLDGLAAARPDWHIILIWPVTKIDEDSLPRRANLHYLGPRPYDDLPAYLAGWDVALLPFARNESNRFISPTETPEYLAARQPVVSTSIHDVVHPYGEQALVHIADTVTDTVAAVEAAPVLDQEAAGV